ILAAVFMMALLSAVVMVSLRGAVRTAQIHEVRAQLQHQDRLVRQSAQRLGRASLMLLDLSTGQVCAQDEHNTAAPRLQLPEGVRIERLILPDTECGGGRLAIACSDRGHTPSYAILLSGPRGERQWLLTVGLTGEQLELRDEQDVRETMALLQIQRHDAH
ncbi:MAG TPA: hypothetical protein VLH09_02725, partial [Bryobacteraceae bacterium]|nr:hypothetical protein [Bryobacteraceae bacterium]